MDITFCRNSYKQKAGVCVLDENPKYKLPKTIN